jgi:hypothetical protein
MDANMVDLSITLKICILHENGFEELRMVLFETLFLGLHIMFHKKLVRPSTEAQHSHERAPPNF